MVIGRADERQKSVHTHGSKMSRLCFDVVRGTHLGPAAIVPQYFEAGHMTAFEPLLDFAKPYLNPTGRPHMGMCATRLRCAHIHGRCWLRKFRAACDSQAPGAFGRHCRTSSRH